MWVPVVQTSVYPQPLSARLPDMLGITLIRADRNEARYFEQGRITIGSAAQADLRLEHPSVQPEHALIQVTEGVVVIQRANRHAQVTMNGTPVTGVHILSDAQRFTVGDIELVIQCDDPQEKTKKNFDRSELQAALVRKKANQGSSVPQNRRPSSPKANRPSRPSADRSGGQPAARSSGRSGAQPARSRVDSRAGGQARRTASSGPEVPTDEMASPSRRPSSAGGDRNRSRPAPSDRSGAGSRPSRSSDRSGPTRTPSKPSSERSGNGEFEKDIAAVAGTHVLSADSLPDFGRPAAAASPDRTFEDLPEITADAFEPFEAPDADEENDEIVQTQRFAVNQLATAFATRARETEALEAVNATTQPSAKTFEAETKAEAPEKPQKASFFDESSEPLTAFPTSYKSQQTAEEDVAEDENKLQVGEVFEPELNTQQLSSQQVASLYLLYKKRKAEKKTEKIEKVSPGPQEVPEPAEADDSDEDFSLHDLLLEGPEAFGVKTWEEVAAEAAEFQEPEAHYGENRLLSLMDKDAENAKQRTLILGGVTLLMVVITAFLLLTPSEPITIGQQEEDKVKEIDISGMSHIEHIPENVRCYSERECIAMAERRLQIARTEWENRDADYENRYRAFEQADIARLLVEEGGADPSALDGLSEFWDQSRDELDALHKSLRVSFYIAMSQEKYEDAFKVIELTKMFFPSPRAREYRWAENLRLGLKEKGIEAVINHKRAVRGRWN